MTTTTTVTSGLFEDTARTTYTSTKLDVEQNIVDHSIQDLTIRGALSGERFGLQVASFLGIQYASIPGRWYQSVLVDFAEQKGILNATRWGPRSPQTVDAMHHSTSHLYPRMSTYDTMSEYECLNLNVYSPVTALCNVGEVCNRLLPVVVWIHGGSFEWGDGTCECDGQYLVRHSIEIGLPILLVAFNYRLGMLGFFTSEELRREARDRGEEGFSNLGFFDQRLALKWVQTNIHYFGGDPTQVMLAGESAGAISVLAHIRGTVPVAQSAFLMSPGTVYPRTFAETQVTFDKICDQLNLKGESDHSKLAVLRQLSCEELHRLGADRLSTILCEDPIFFQPYPKERFEEVSSFPSWLGRVVAGQTKQELAVLGHYWALLTTDQLLHYWQQIYGDREYAEELLRAYGIKALETTNGRCISRNDHRSDIIQALVEYTSDALFSKAVRSIAETHLRQPTSGQASPCTETYLYRFDQEDVLSSDESQKSKAYHSLDNAFFFHFPQVAGHDAPEDFRNTANVFSTAAIQLAYGESSWTALKSVRGGVSDRFATFSSQGIQEHDLAPTRWACLVDTSDRKEKFLLGIRLAFELTTLALQPASASLST